MSLSTKFLKLFKWDLDSPEDLESDFNIEESLNNNWEKIDKKLEELDGISQQLEENCETKVDKVEGLGLSQENFTTALKKQLLK